MVVSDGTQFIVFSVISFTSEYSEKLFRKFGTKFIQKKNKRSGFYDDLV